MGQYTDELEWKEYDIDPEEDDYTDKLIRIAKCFRPAGEALDLFLQEHGYCKDIRELPEKLAFFRTVFSGEGIPCPRDLKRWFTENKSVGRKDAFRICFAFRLNPEETQDFFRRICLTRGIDCHNMEEAVYYFCILKGYSWETANRMLEELPRVIPRESVDLEKEILYTSSIVNEIESFESPEELVSYLSANQSQFIYHHATAYRFIREIWFQIAGIQGYAAREREDFLSGADRDKNLYVSQGREKYEEKEAHALSDWEIYLQILGVDRIDADALPSDRSLKPILKDNILLHPLAEDCFPDRLGIQNILAGEPSSDERVRKLLILLLFYRFWIKLAGKRRDGTYSAKGGDADRCLAQMNRYLLDAGYPSLYPGNPYDWLFLYAIQDEFPLSSFRCFMNELFITAGLDNA